MFPLIIATLKVSSNCKLVSQLAKLTDSQSTHIAMSLKGLSVRKFWRFGYRPLYKSNGITKKRASIWKPFAYVSGLARKHVSGDLVAWVFFDVNFDQTTRLVEQFTAVRA